MAEILSLNPKDIIVNQDLRGRHFAPSKKEVDDLAQSIKEFGQLEPAGIWYNDKHEAELVWGFTRHVACSQLKRDLECVEVSEAERSKLFLLNIIENNKRNETTPVDDAFNQERLRKEFGKTNKEIAAIYRCSGAWVGQLSKLLKLEEKVLKQVHAGELQVSAAIALADLPADKQAAALADAQATEASSASARKNKGKKNATKAANVKKAAKKAAKPAKAEKEGPQPRKAREIFDFFQSLTGPVEKPVLRDTAKKIMSFVAGKTSEKVMEAYLRELLKAPAKEPANA